MTQSPRWTKVVVMIGAVAAVFLVLGLFRSRKKPKPDRPGAANLPGRSTILPPAGAVTPTPGGAVAKKACPRCHTYVDAADVTCFFCGYKFT